MDFSNFARSYNNDEIVAYDSTTGENYSVTDVVLSNSGELSFNFRGKRYSLSVVEIGTDDYSYAGIVDKRGSFECYENGILNTDAHFGIDVYEDNWDDGIDDGAYFSFSLSWNHLDGCNLYFNFRYWNRERQR